jgi:DNA polymerase III delta subunit
MGIIREIINEEDLKNSVRAIRDVMLHGKEPIALANTASCR